ncbi:hypothetical protein FT663_01554 [Candidozyma haemuli var. vulneris]|uniref:Zn(2)-C6 fungal-type domain-containing protein n=1 Tax=Candidozyma haemuli TaxID=45357 RepID=A0A2V1ARF6_9ASCO|nr:hypothetical protein CXQ85_002109 [[Candida] haemuloni]KAF3990709.1 hypothetical protein FT662_02132 [[Candida] haemuloni var. vulneris]KAF3994323.1 hypothetical protein FT663_01554 [[Candida] haemuloni var. vulneris]PVH20322.1 hypothetical protein CXQ85_002109 [[Candida] haemuloni]
MFSKFDSKRGNALDMKGGPGLGTPAESNNGSASEPRSPLESGTDGPETGPSTGSKTAGTRSKSKFGCLTCKVRKKKCEGTKPVCRDCQRFNKECVWIDYDTMKVEEIRRLRLKVKEQESCNKVRIRRPASKRSSSSVTKPAHGKGPSKESSSPPAHAQLDPEHFKPEIDAHNKLSDFNTSTASLDYVRALREAYPVNSLPGMNFSTDNELKNLGDIHHNAVVKNKHSFNMRTPSAAHSPRALSPTLMELEALDDQGTSSSPSGLLNFLKEVSAFSGGLSNGQSPHQDAHVPTDESKDESMVKFSPNFSIPGFLDQVNHMPATSSSSTQLNQLASAFNAVFIPPPQAPPPLLPELDASGHYLYDYYVNTLSPKVSIAPVSQNESNSYQKVFLPLAQRDKGVLCGILAWAGFHLGGQWTAEASMYAESAVKILTQDIDFSGTLPAFHEDRRSILNKLAVILILCGAEICRGDVKYWSVYLNWGWKLLKDNGGITKFDNNKEEHWLITNFAYHDVLASSVNERGTYFPLETYQKIFKDPQGVSRGNLNPLLGVSKILYRYIAEISSLSLDCKKELNAYYKRQSPKVTPISYENGVSTSPDMNKPFDETASEVSEHGKVGSILYSITARAKKIEYKIDTAKPDPDDLENLNDHDLEMQLMCFEAYQLSCKLFLRQSIMKLNPSAIESQILMNDLMKCINLLVETPMQATLVFPLFIAGIHSVADFDREHMRDILNQMMETYGPWNVQRIKYVMEQVWDLNPGGDKVVDWLAILKELGWEINFA